MGTAEDAARSLLEGLEGDAFRAKVVELAQTLTSATREEDEPLVRLDEVLPRAFDLMDARAEGREKPIETPWPDMNEQLPGGGYWAGCHILVSGTGVGKTTYAKQVVHHAAKQGVPCGVIGLEIDLPQSALRFAGEAARLSWSEAYTGQMSKEKRRKMRESAETLSGLPIYLEQGDAMGWPASKLRSFVGRMRKAHPEGPMLIVVDFLQLIGSEEGSGRQELRERVGQAAYQARMVASQMGATVLLISSVARENYGRLSGFEALESAGFEVDEVKGEQTVLERFLRAPEKLVGLGKESGEIEFAADTVTAAIALPKSHGSRLVVFALAKLRVGASGWCSLVSNGVRFASDDTHGRSIIDKLSKPNSKGDGEGTPPKRTPDKAGANRSKPKPYDVG